jgi:hypothetical protein
MNRSKCSFLYLTALLLSIAGGVKGQAEPNAKPSEPEKSQGELKETGKNDVSAPIQNTSEQTTTKAESTAQGAESRKSGETTEQPKPLSEPQPQVIQEVKESSPIKLTNEIRPPVDKPKPSGGNTDSIDAPFGLGLEVDALWNTDPGFDLFSKHDVTAQFALWFSYDILPVTKQFVLAGEVGFGLGGVSDETRQSLDFKWSMQNYKTYLAANLRWLALPWMHPHLRLAGGASFDTVDFKLAESNSLLQSKAKKDTYSGFISLGGGVTFQTPTGLFNDIDEMFASLSLGLLVEGGYTIASPISLSLNKAGRNEIEKKTADLGKLDLSGAYIRTSLLARF